MSTTSVGTQYPKEIPNQTTSPVNNTPKAVNFKQGQQYDTVELSSKKEGLSTGAKIGIASVGLLALAAAGDAMFNKCRYMKKIFKMSKDKVDDVAKETANKTDDIAKKYKEIFTNNKQDTEASLKRAKEFFEKNPKATTWVDDAAKNPTTYKCERVSRHTFGEITGTTVIDDTTYTICSGSFGNEASRTFTNSRGSIRTYSSDCAEGLKQTYDDVVKIGKQEITLHPGTNGGETTCSIIEDGVQKIYPQSVFEQAADHVISGASWSLKDIKPIAEIRHPKAPIFKK